MIARQCLSRRSICLFKARALGQPKTSRSWDSSVIRSVKVVVVIGSPPNHTPSRAQIVDGSDGSALSHLNRWPSPMPVGGLLVSVGHVQDCLLRERFSPDLEADGQVLRGEAAANAQRRRTSQTERGGQPRPIALTALLGVDDRVRFYLRGGNPHGRHDQHVRMFQGGQHLLAQQGPKLQRFIVGQGWSQVPGEVGYPVVVLDLLQPLPYQLPIVGGGLDP